MGCVHRFIVWITLLHAGLSLPSEDDRRWGEARKLSGSYKIINRRIRPTTEKRGTTVDDGGFVFPGLASRIGESDEIQIPEECKKIGLCDHVPDYPQDIVDKLIADIEERSALPIFNKDSSFPPKVAERIGADEDNIELCSTNETVFTPVVGLDVYGKPHFIANSSKKPTQTFRIELCVERGHSPCTQNPPIISFQTGYEGSCIQKYALREMYVLDKTWTKLEKETIQIPTCCSCVLRQL